MVVQNVHPVPPDAPGSPEALVPLSRLVEAWVADGLITPEQGARLRRSGDVRVVVDRPHGRTPVVLEALAYLGGVVVLVGCLLVARLYWGDLGGTTRTALLAAGTAALGVGGLAAPQHTGVGVRLRSVLWLVATGALAATTAVLTDQVLDLADRHAALATTAVTACGAGVAWLRHRHLPQHVALVVTLMLTAGTLVADVAPDHGSLPGVGAWAVAVGWLVLGWTGVTGPRELVLPLASVAAILAAMTTSSADLGLVLAIGTVTGVLGLALYLADLLVLGIGTVGALMVLPAAVTRWFPDSRAVPFAILGLGVVVVGLAVSTARRRGRAGSLRAPGTPGSSPTDRRGPRWRRRGPAA